MLMAWSTMRLMMVMTMLVVMRLLNLVLVSNIRLHIALVTVSSIHYACLTLALVEEPKRMRRALRHWRPGRGGSLVAVRVPATIDRRAVAD